jgi:Ribosomal protein L1p/L10e family
MSQHGKRYRSALEQIDREASYSPLEAVRLLKSTEGAKFDETVEAHFRLGLNVRHADQQLRGTLMLPNGIGKEVRVAVFAEGEKAREAEEARTSSARPTSRSGSRRDSSTSTWRSRRRIRWETSASSDAFSGREGSCPTRRRGL